MAELANNKQFRFVPQVQAVIDELAPHLSPQDRQFLHDEIEPMLVHRDWQVEDAITRALQCCGTSTTVTPGTVLTSDSFARSAGLPLGIADAALGGSPKPWSPLSGTWETDGASRADKSANGAGGVNGNDVVVVDTQANTLVQADVLATGSTSASVGVINRCVDNNNYYFFFLYRSAGGVYLYYVGKTVAGVTTYLGASPYTPTTVFSPGNRVLLKLSVTGSTIVATDGTDTFTLTDTDLTTGTKQGMLVQKAGVTDLDSFKVTAT